MSAVRSTLSSRLGAAAVALFSLASAACGSLHAAGSAPLPSVSPAPTPQAPHWIVRYGPRGIVSTLAQIRVEFAQPLIPLESLETPDESAKLAYFSIEPALPGRFRFLTPHMVGFQGDAALPIATRVRVVVKKGLTDLHGDVLSGDFAWTFETQPLALTSDIDIANGPVTLSPTLDFHSNAELDPASLEEKTSVRAVGSSVALPIDVKLARSSAPEDDGPRETFDPSMRDWFYEVTLRKPLPKATAFDLRVAAGLLPAHGNLPLASDDALDVGFETYSPLSFVDVKHFNDGESFVRFADGDPELSFNNPIDGASARANISISPSPNPWATLVEDSDGDSIVSLDPAAFNPATHYVITIGAGLKDSYGQTLGKTVTASFDTGDVAPAFWAPSGFNIFPSGSDLQLDISAINLTAPAYYGTFRSLRPSDLVYVDPTDSYVYSEASSLDKVLRVSKPYALHLKRNVADDVPLSLRDLIGARNGLLAYEFGIGGPSAGHNMPIDGAVELTNLGVFEQWFPSGGLVLAHHLSDGSPVGGARVDIYRSKLDAALPATPPSPCATATTGADGRATFDSSSLALCMGSASSFTSPPGLLAIVREGSDWSFARSSEWTGGYGYGIYPGWDDGTPQSTGTIYSDRDLYQQGEDAWFTGAAYYTQRGILHRDAGTRYRLTLEDPSGKKTDLGIVTTDAYGAFSRRLTFAKDQALGYYLIHAKSAAGVAIDGDFRVAQFRPPNFKVTLTLDKQYATPGDVVNAASSSAYLFGAPVQGAKTTFYVTRNPAYLAPPGWDDYSFGRQWEWPETQPSVSSDVLQNAVTSAADGSARQIVSVGRDLPYPMTYEVDAQTTDVSDLTVGDSKTFLALPDLRLIGVKNDWIAQAGAPTTISIIVTDPAGAVRRGQRIHVELQSMQFNDVTQVVEDSDTSLDQIEYRTVDQANVVSGPGPVGVTLTPSQSGEYRVRANLAGANGDATASDSFVWVTGDNPVFWAGENPDQLQIQLDKKSYAPGDWATALIQSPYPAADLYFAVIRQDTLYHVVEHVHGSAPTIRFRVTADMLPNAAVEAVLVRRGTPLSKTTPGSVKSLARIGFAPFEVKTDGERLKVKVTPAYPTVEPGDAESVDLTLTEESGAPVHGQFTVAVANEAVLQLSGYRLPDLVGIVYADRVIATRFADNRPNVVLEQPQSPVDKGWGFGGGFSAAAASTRVRTNFKPLAYFAGAVDTDARGHARVTFHVPDDLTTWRVMAVATGASAPGSSNYRFGTSDATFVTTKPLVTNPLLPQFARPGDRFLAGVSVTNASGLSGNVRVSGSVTGSLRFDETSGRANNDGAQAELRTGTQAIRFPVVAGEAGNARVSFATAGARASDAFALSIPIVPVVYPEEVIESGVTDGTASIPVAIDRDVRADSGGLGVSLASTLLPEITEPASRRLDSDCLPFLEPASTQLAIATDVIVLGRKYGHVDVAFAPAAIAATDISYIEKLRRDDGGLGAWPRAKESDPILSAYAAETLASAKAAGLSVDASLFSGLRTFLEAVLADPQDYYPLCEPCQIEARLYSLDALSALGETRDDFVSELYADRENLALDDKIRLARYLLRLPAWRAQGHDMAVKLRESVYETGRTATVNSNEIGYWWQSLASDQSLMLQLMIADGQNGEFIDRMVQGLLALRHDGTWPDDYDDAHALAALIEYGDLQPAPPDFAATATLGPRAIGAANFIGYKTPLAHFDTPMRSLAPGSRQTLELRKQGSGTLHYFVSYSYSLAGSQPGTVQGLRIVRYLRVGGQTQVLAMAGLIAPPAPVTVAAGQVFDVEVEVIVDHPVDNVVITDPLPAGLEAVDTTFKTSTHAFADTTDSWAIDYQTIYRDRVVAFASHLEAGDYSFHYLAQSVTPGDFSWPGAQAQLEYAPEIFGRTSSGSIIVTP